MALTGNIKYELLKRLHLNYLTHKHKILSRDLGGKFETRAIWFENNDALKEFCRAVIDETNNISGVRFYLGAYDVKQIDYAVTEEDVEKVPLDPTYVDQLTLAFVTTQEVETGRHVDVYTDPKRLLVPAKNHGKLCPPDTGCE